MSRNIKVLLLVAEAWRRDDSGGNSMDNFFRGMKGVEFAHVYCCDKLPDSTDVCQHYFQIPENEAIRSFFNRKRVGHKLHSVKGLIDADTKTKSASATSQKSGVRQKLFRWVKNIRPECLITVRMFLWRFCNWKTPELDKFILDFNPDVIYAPCYAFPFQCALTRHVKQLTGKKIITWSADDNYSLRQFSLSPFYWLNRFWNRHSLRKTYPCYNEFYSISEDEIKEMSPIVGLPMKVLRKGVVVPEHFLPRAVNTPLKFIYAGGLYCNRYKSLIRVADALRKINANGVKAELHIYTGSKLQGTYAASLNDGKNVFNHGLINSSELSDIYQKSDVAIHCESFDLKYRLQTRLSFSTKIIDCFQSGCAILAIAWEEHTGIKYLQKEDAAFCVTNLDDIEGTIKQIVSNPQLIQQYALKAYECEKRNHRIEDVQKTLYDSFLRCKS